MTDETAALYFAFPGQLLRTSFASQLHENAKPCRRLMTAAASGEVTRAVVTTDRETGRSRGFGFVEMASGGAEAIAALNGKQLGGRALTVNEAKPREDRGSRTGSS